MNRIKLSMTAAAVLTMSLTGLGLNTSSAAVHSGTHVPMKEAAEQTYPLSRTNLQDVTSVSFITNLIGFMSGNDGIYKTVDGGKTWLRVYKSSDPVLGLDAKYQPVGKEEYVLAYTKTALINTTNGRNFSTLNEGRGNVNLLQGVSLLSDGGSYFIMGGGVLASDPMSGGYSRKTPPEAVTSISMVADDMGYAATTNAVYKTVDHGRHWTKVFTAPLSKAPWKTRLVTNGTHVAVLFSGGDVGMSQTAFILYESNDSGKTWEPMFDEGYFAGDYQGVHLVSANHVGTQPGPVAVLSNGEILFVSFNPENTGTAMVTGVMPNGKTVVNKTVGTSGSKVNAFDFPNHPVALSALDSKHIWAVGSKNGKAVVMASNDGGTSWRLQ